MPSSWLTCSSPSVYFVFGLLVTSLKKSSLQHKYYLIPVVIIIMVKLSVVYCTVLLLKPFTLASMGMLVYFRKDSTMIITMYNKKLNQTQQIIIIISVVVVVSNVIQQSNKCSITLNLSPLHIVQSQAEQKLSLVASTVKLQ